MEVGQKVWTATVFTHGHDSPYVYLKERTVVAVTESGVVVEAQGHPTIVEKESNLYATRAGAAAAAIVRLTEDRASVFSKWDAEIDKLQKICLQAQAAAV